jgi:hypothetical protein
MTDYKKAIEIVKNIPKFYLGQEVLTKFGKGIIIELNMPANGLYITPEQASFVV